MREWRNDGSFLFDASVRIPGWDRAGLERLQSHELAQDAER
jgi:hypothetical protein